MIPASLAVAAGAIAQAMTGLGFSLVASPFLVAALGRSEGVRFNLLLSGSLNVVMLVGERRHAQYRTAALMLVPAVILTPILAWAFDQMDGRVLAIAAGVLTLLSAAALAIGIRIHRARGRGGALAAGAISAAMNVLAGIGGPPIAMYGVNADWPAVSVRPTLQAYFLGLNAIGLAVLGLPEGSLLPWLGLGAGWLAGRAVIRRIPDTIARPATLAIAAVGGVIAIATAGG